MIRDGSGNCLSDIPAFMRRGKGRIVIKPVLADAGGASDFPDDPARKGYDGIETSEDKEIEPMDFGTFVCRAFNPNNLK